MHMHVRIRKLSLFFCMIGSQNEVGLTLVVELHNLVLKLTSFCESVHH